MINAEQILMMYGDTMANIRKFVIVTNSFRQLKYRINHYIIQCNVEGIRCVIVSRTNKFVHEESTLQWNNQIMSIHNFFDFLATDRFDRTQIEYRQWMSGCTESLQQIASLWCNHWWPALRKWNSRKYQSWHNEWHYWVQTESCKWN